MTYSDKRLPGEALSVCLKATSPAYQNHVENLNGLLDLAAYWTEEANRTFQSDQTDVGQEVKDYAHAPGTTVHTVLQRRIKNHKDRQIPSAFRMLNQRKFECYLANPATCAEIQKQVEEMGPLARPV